MYPFIKRFFDVLAALALLLLLLPLLLPVAVILRLTAEGAVFYFQQRIGFHNKPFNIWKFATMLRNSPNMGSGTITLRRDPRVTGPGRFLRKTKINELPQIVNVLIGDMSFVGPRPLDERGFQAYSNDVRTVIYNTRPGITGIGSIVFRDEERLLSQPGVDPKAFYASHIAPYKGALELWYLQNQSFATDLKLLLLTAWVVVFPNPKLVYRIFKNLPEKQEALMI
ncbi:MAG: sugar transferase [Saprospiraceae bacterium]|nr:sugar transferase [Saprospiraceae bacterium]